VLAARAPPSLVAVTSGSLPVIAIRMIGDGGSGHGASTSHRADAVRRQAVKALATCSAVGRSNLNRSAAVLRLSGRRN
jgi:hypothetical protein